MATEDIGEGRSRDPCWQAFKQQRMRVWRPIYTPRFTIPFYLGCGLIFGGLGFLLIGFTANVIEVKVDYTEVRTENGAGSFDLQIDAPLEPPIWVYYELSDFFQNHRRYVRSYSGKQLQYAGAAKDAEEVQFQVNKFCEQEEVRQRGNRLLYPCGLVPMSIFNDSFAFLTREQEETLWRRVPMDSDPATIAWPADLGKFRNLDPEAIDEERGLPNQVAKDMWILERFPPVECEQTEFRDGEPYEPVHVAKQTVIATDRGGEQVRAEGVVDCVNFLASEGATCNFTRGGQPFRCEGSGFKEVRRKAWGVESGHLMVWMRIAGLPTFRKLLAKIDQKLEKGTYRVLFENNFPVAKFEGRKTFVLTTGSMWGGHSDNLGWGCVVVGGCCLIFGIWKLVQCIHCPRPLGDVSLLSKQ